MKRFVSVILAVVLVLSMGAYADAASDHANDYYSRHKADVTPDGKKYIVNSPDGYVTAWSSPEEQRAYGNIANGTTLEVTASYLGWNAVTYINADGLEQCYWIPADMMTEQISGETFIRDNTERLSYDKSDLKSMKYYNTKGKIYLYTYPGSGVVSSELEGIGKFDAGPVFSAVYTDYDGLKWGYLEYYGDWNYKAWICLNDPENGELPARDNGNTVYEAVNPCEGEAKIHYSIAVKDPGEQTVERVIIIAAAVIVLSVIVAAILSADKKKKPRREKKREEIAEERSDEEKQPEQPKKIIRKKEKTPKEPKPEKAKEPKPEKAKEPKPEKAKEPKPKKRKKQKSADSDKTEYSGRNSYEDKILEESWQKKMEERKPKPKTASRAKKGRHEK